MPERLGLVSRLCCSMCYALATEYRFKEFLKGIQTLPESSLNPFNEITADYVSRHFRDMLVFYCGENFQKSLEESKRIEEILGTLGSPSQQNYKEYVHPATVDEIRTIADLVVFTDQTSGWLLAHHPEKGKQADLKDILSQLRVLDDVLERRELPAWMYFLSKLYAKLMIQGVDRLSIHSAFHRHGGECSVALDFVKEGFAVLWPTQIDPIISSLEGKDVLLTAETGTGKSLLGTILVASKRTDPGLSVYTVPTRALAHQISSRIAKLAYGGNPAFVKTVTQEDEVSPEDLAICKTIVGTYEKIDGLFRENLLSGNNVALFVVDECHTISDFNRGITLDFLLTQMNPRFHAQRVMLSAVLPEEEGPRFAQWAKAEYIRGKDWRRTSKIEKIGMGRMEIPIPHDIDEESRTRLVKQLEGYGTATTKAEAYVPVKIIEQIRAGKIVLVTAESRPKVEELANQIAEMIATRTTSLLARDEMLRERLEENRSQMYQYIAQIRGSELVLPKSAETIIKLLSRRVVFHHAGLPKSLRRIIEEMIEKRVPLVVVSTTTLEAGVNFPVDSVIVKRSVLTKRVRQLRKRLELRNPVFDYILARYENALFAAYSNIIGRAGRAEFSERGESIFYVDNSDEALAFLEMRYKKGRSLGEGADLYTVSRLNELSFQSKIDPLRVIARDLNQSRGRLLSNLLHAIYRSEGNMEELVLFLKKTWLWRVVKELPFLLDLETTFPRLISDEVRFLCEIGFARESVPQKYELTPMGSFVNRSLLNPVSAKKVIEVLRNMFTIREISDDDVRYCMLNAVGLTYEMRLSPFDRAPRESSLSSFERDLITRLGRLHIEYDLLSVRIASILHRWSTGVLVDDIIQEFDLHDSDHGMIEELLPKTAMWVLHSARLFLLGIELPNRKRVLALLQKIARSVDLGTNSDVAASLLELSIDGVGRNSAVFLVQTFSPTSLSALASLDQTEFKSRFPGKEDLAQNVLAQIAKRASEGSS